MKFGQYLKTLRKRRGLSIRKLALSAGVSNSYLSQIETGQRGIPSPWILQKLAGPLQVDYEELLQAAGYLFLHEGENSAEGHYIFRDGAPGYRQDAGLDLADVLQQPNIMFKGVLLTAEDKEELREVLESAWNALQERKKQGKG